MYILTIAIKTPLMQAFAYKSEQKLAKGVRVRVSFAHRETIGVVWGYQEQSEFELKEILEVLDEVPILSKEVMHLIDFAAKYYMQSLGEMVFAALPQKLRLGKEAQIKREIAKQEQHSTTPTLNEEQQRAVHKIEEGLHHYQAFLLHGITGSGKTEVYLTLAEKVINSGKQILVLVPEIGLTPQLMQRFAARLNTKVAVVHSGLNSTQKLDNYLSIASGDCGVLLGTRSAIWTPFANLGLVIIDEEHDSSFKQHSTPRYNAKNLAFVLAKYHNIPLILGSATPSAEVLKGFMDKKITHIALTQRASGALPQVDIIDTRGSVEILSEALLVQIQAQLNADKQVMLFINRRGYAPIYFCTSCGHKQLCPHCDKELIYHLDSHKLKCHICETHYHPEKKCHECGEETMQVLGYGTQRIEHNLMTIFKGVDIIRIDRDSTTKKKVFEQKLDYIHSGKKCIIIGTQMLAKGHDFKQVNLVGVLDVDYALLSTHFRATEELMQLLIQVSGRAGREDGGAKVLIQTHYPENKIFEYVKTHNYVLFIKGILSERKQANMPPFSHQATVVANSKVAEKAQQYLLLMQLILQKIPHEESLISPVLMSAMHKKSGYYYYEINIFTKHYNTLHLLLQTLIVHQPKLPHSVRFYIDVDPL